MRAPSLACPPAEMQYTPQTYISLQTPSRSATWLSTARFSQTRIARWLISPATSNSCVAKFAPPSRSARQLSTPAPHTPAPFAAWESQRPPLRQIHRRKRTNHVARYFQLSYLASGRTAPHSVQVFKLSSAHTTHTHTHTRTNLESSFSFLSFTANCSAIPNSGMRPLQRPWPTEAVCVGWSRIT